MLRLPLAAGLLLLLALATPAEGQGDGAAAGAPAGGIVYRETTSLPEANVLAALALGCCGGLDAVASYERTLVESNLDLPKVHADESTLALALLLGEGAEPAGLLVASGHLVPLDLEFGTTKGTLPDAVRVDEREALRAIALERGKAGQEPLDPDDALLWASLRD